MSDDDEVAQIKAAGEALIAWIESQELTVGVAVPALALTIRSMVQAEAELAQLDVGEGLRLAASLVIGRRLR